MGHERLHPSLIGSRSPLAPPGAGRTHPRKDLLVARVKLGEIGQERAQEFLDKQAVLRLAWDEELADQVAGAFARCGRGQQPAD
jgi:hypothetical protein